MVPFCCLHDFIYRALPAQKKYIIYTVHIYEYTVHRNRYEKYFTYLLATFWDTYSNINELQRFTF